MTSYPSLCRGHDRAEDWNSSRGLFRLCCDTSRFQFIGIGAARAKCAEEHLGRTYQARGLVGNNHLGVVGCSNLLESPQLEHRQRARVDGGGVQRRQAVRFTLAAQSESLLLALRL